MSPGWVRAAALALTVAVGAALFVVLGNWQFDRYQAKSARRDAVQRNYRAAPVPLGQLLPDPGGSAPGGASPGASLPTRSLPGGLEWRPVSAVGQYLPEHTVLVRNRPLRGRAGYEVLVPFRVAGGGLLLIDRGWVPAGGTAAEPDDVPAPPTGRARVVARLRPSEPGGDRPAPAGQALRIDVPSIAEGLPEPVYPGYAVLAEEEPAPARAPQPLPEPEPGLGVHLAYAVQWWAFAAAAPVLAVVIARRSRLKSVPAAPDYSPEGQ